MQLAQVQLLPQQPRWLLHQLRHMPCLLQNALHRLGLQLVTALLWLLLHLLLHCLALQLGKPPQVLLLLLLLLQFCLAQWLPQP
jgi:hypothetical protein